MKTKKSFLINALQMLQQPIHLEESNEANDAQIPVRADDGMASPVCEDEIEQQIE
jgi:hypothetical protein